MNTRKSKQLQKAKTTRPVEALDTGMCVFRHVTRTSRAVASLYDPALERIGLTGHQFNMLMTLHRMGPNTVGGVARLVGMDSSSVPRAIAPMQRCSWVSVTLGKDRRQRIIDITPSGRSQLMLALPIWEEVQRAMLDHIGLSNWQSMLSALKAIRDAAAEVGKVD